MRRLILFTICIILFVIDSTCMPFFSVKGYYPSLLTIFIICFSINTDKWGSLWIAVFAGVLQDLCFTNIIGINPFINIIVCIGASIIGENIFKERFLIPTGAVFLFSLIRGTLLFVILYLIGYKINFQSQFFIALFNTVIALLVYKLIYKLLQKPYMKKEWKFREG